jgi:hypothetical protein
MQAGEWHSTLIMLDEQYSNNVIFPDESNDRIWHNDNINNDIWLINTQNYRTVGPYQISNTCLQTYPCQHTVIFPDGTSRRMWGDKIYTMLREENLSDSEFDNYAEFIQKRDNPTPEEIAERNLRQEENMKKQKEKEARDAEINNIINKHKASSVIDRLKQKNNIQV